MAKHKVVLEFEATTGSTPTSGANKGWTETFYDPDDSTDGIAEIKASSLQAARLLLLTPGWSCVAARVSQLDINANLIRRGRLVRFAPADAVGKYTGLGVSTVDEQAYDALEIAINSTGGHRRSWSMRGIGNEVVSAGSRFLNPPMFQRNFRTFSGYMLGTNSAPGFAQQTAWAVRYRTLVVSPDALNGTWEIVGVDIANGVGTGGTASAPFLNIAQIANATDIPVGASLVIGRVQGMTGLQGTWVVQKVQAVGTAGVKLAPKRRTTVRGTLSGSAFAKAYVFALEVMSSLFPEYGTSRRTGRPSQLVRGRRSNRSS